MEHTIGISGSTIYSVREKLPELFTQAVEHIEIGEFNDEGSLQDFLNLHKQSQHSFGLHSPRFRQNSKYDLLEAVFMDSELAWEQFEDDIAWVKETGAAYILVHFPYFKDEQSDISNEKIEKGLQRLSYLQDRYDVQIVCEAKLGLRRSPVGIEALDQFPLELWTHYGVKLCIDIGDYLIASDKAYSLIEKWLDHILVVHLHNVEFSAEHYIWVPIHPSHENDGIHYSIEAILRLLARGNQRFFILEHTPETQPRERFVEEGLNWLREILNEEGLTREPVSEAKAVE